MSASEEVDVAAELRRLRERVDDLEAENERLREENEKLRERVDDVEDELDARAAVRWEGPNPADMEIESTDVGNSVFPYRAITSKVDEEDVDDLEERVDDLEAGDVDVEAGETAAETTAEIEHETRLEEVVALPETIAEENLTPNQQRARFVASDVLAFTDSVPAGRSIGSSDLRRVLSAGTDSSGHSEDVRRTREFLDQFGGDAVEVVERRGETRVVFDEDLAERLAKIAARKNADASHTCVTRAEA